MKKYSIKFLLFISICLLLTISNNVYAGNATAFEGASFLAPYRYAPEGKQGLDYPYTQTQLRIDMNGTVYKAFCVDPGLHLNRGHLMYTCTPYNELTGLKWLLSQQDTLDEHLLAIAIRFYGTMKGLVLGKDLSGKMASFVRYVETRFLHYRPTIEFYGDYPSYFTGDTTIIEQAYSLAETAAGMKSATNESGATLNFKKRNAAIGSQMVSYEVNSTKKILPEDIKFTCEGPGCQSETIDYAWDGMKTVLNIPVICDEDYNIKVEFKDTTGEGVYVCSSFIQDEQNLYILVPEGADTSMTFPGAPLFCEGDVCGTIEPKIEGNIKNCCDDSNNVSEAKEHELNELFCDNTEFSVTKYDPKGGASYYVDREATIDKEYCKMYCTERVWVEAPGSITATTGRYFELSKTKSGTTSPYVEGYRRCRIRIDFPKWQRRYDEKVKSEVSNYNDYQYNEAWRITYQDAEDHKKENQKETTTITCTASCTATDTGTCTTTPGYPKCTPPEAEASCSDSWTSTAEVIYTKYPFSLFKDWYAVRLKTELSDIYKAYELEPLGLQGTTKAKYSDNWSAWFIDLSKVEAEMNKKKGKYACGDSQRNGDAYAHCQAYWTCEYEETEAEKHIEDVPSALTKYTEGAVNAEDGYNQAAIDAIGLEQKLDKCVNYFADPTHHEPLIDSGGKYKGGIAEENFKFKASTAFNYTQVYLNEEGDEVQDRIGVDFELAPGCEITGPFPGPDSVDGLEDKKYSPVYSIEGDTEKLADFHEANLELQEGVDIPTNYLDTEYTAYKVFRHDAKYKAACSWNEKGTKYHTLVPSGGSKEEAGVINYTEHEKEYRVYLTTYDGTYQTEWLLTGLGTGGRFDDYFYHNGNMTCSNQQPAGAAMLTCKLHAEHELVLMGYCNNNPGGSANNDEKYCYPYEEKNDLFNFKVVDPSNIFPAETEVDGKEYAYNWKKTTKGREAQEEIERRGEKDTTYSPDNMTYSFTLTPADMKHIKNYNESRELSGGYSDFKLECKCTDACRKCKSEFLTNLYNNKVKYDSSYHSVTGWSNKRRNIEEVRSSILGG